MLLFPFLLDTPLLLFVLLLKDRLLFLDLDHWVYSHDVNPELHQLKELLAYLIEEQLSFLVAPLVNGCDWNLRLNMLLLDSGSS